MNDPYKILGLSPEATEDEVKKAYRKKAFEFHPDRNQGDKAAEEKFKEITAAYEAIKNPRPQNPHGDFSPFRGFEDMMRGWMNQNVQRQAITRCSISLKDAFSGCEAIISAFGKDISVKIPAGVETGMRIRIPNVVADPQSRESVDLIVQIVVDDDDTYVRNGPHIFTKVSIDALDALMGDTVNVTSIDGSVSKVTIPEGFVSGWKIRLPEKGMSVVGSHTRGDHFVIVDIRVETLNDEQKELIKQIKGLQK